jgi:hypothetical protein
MLPPFELNVIVIGAGDAVQRVSTLRQLTSNQVLLDCLLLKV